MIFEPVSLVAQEEEALERIAALREELRWATSEPRKWLGGLRRLVFARAVQGSNSIEGYDASLDDVMAAVEDEEPLDAATETKMALQGYRDAMTYVLQLADDEDLEVDTNLVRSLHYMMLKHDLSKRPGRWRRGSIFVRRDPDNVVVYEGPDVELVPALMEELVRSIGAYDGPELIGAAMAHLNLAMIHPFADGNGRMSRCLQTLILTRSKAVRSAPVFCSIEEWLGRNTDAYYEVLGAVGQGTWHPENNTRAWLRFILTAHYQQALTLKWRIAASEELWGRCERLADSHGVPARSTGALCDAARGLRLRNASYRTAVRESFGDEISINTAGSDFRALVDAGLLKPNGETRARYYTATPTLRSQYEAVQSHMPKPEMMGLFEPKPEQLGLGLSA